MPPDGTIVRGLMIKFENRSNGRYYYLKQERDLLDDYLLVISRGSRGVHRIVRRGFSTREEIEREIAKLSKIRLRRGYSLVECDNASQRN